MDSAKWDLIIRLNEPGRRFVLLLSRKSAAVDSSNENFSVEISFDELKGRGGEGAEKLMGESVLGFFDHLTKGRLDLPKHYLDEN